MLYHSRKLIGTKHSPSFSPFRSLWPAQRRALRIPHPPLILVNEVPEGRPPCRPRERFARYKRMIWNLYLKVFVTGIRSQWARDLFATTASKWRFQHGFSFCPTFSE